MGHSRGRKVPTVFSFFFSYQQIVAVKICWGLDWRCDCGRACVSMNTEISAVQKLATMAGIEFFNNQLPDRVRDKLESAGANPAYYVWASPSITGELGRPVNLAEKIMDRLISGELGISFTSQSSEMPEYSTKNFKAEVQPEEDGSVSYTTLCDTLRGIAAAQTKTSKDEWRAMSSESENVIRVGNLKERLIATGTMSEDNPSIKVAIVRDTTLTEDSFDSAEIPMSEEDEEQLIEDEAVQALVEEIFKEARKPIDELGDAGRNGHIDFLEETISCAFSYLSVEAAVEIFEEVFEKPPKISAKDAEDEDDEDEQN